MNIQIYGKSKCFDTKKAERYFKERRIKYQRIDLPKYGMSAGEFRSVCQAVGGVDKMVDGEGKYPDLDLLRYLTPEAQVEKLLENPSLLRTPIVRNGKQATLGFCPEVWGSWT